MTALPTQLLIVVASLCASTAAAAQTLYRYVDSSGVVHYSDKPLIESTGRSIDRISRSGTRLSPKGGGVVQDGEAPSTDAERLKRKQHEELVKTEERRNLALLATYNSLREIDDAQEFALRDPKRELREAQIRMVDAGRRRAQLQGQMDAYPDREAPADLRQRLSTLEFEFKSLASLVEAKRREVQAINERYEEDRRRYSQLLAKRQDLIEAAGTPPHSAAP